MTDTSTIGDAPEGSPQHAADLPDVDTLFPAEKPDVDELFPASVEQDWRRQQMGRGWVQDALFGEEKYRNARGVLDAFGSTFKEALGPEPFGLSPETEKVLRDHGVFNDYSLGQNSILKSLNEDVIRPAAVGLTALWRSWNAMLPATQAAIMKTGEVRGFPHLARDIAGVPEAYMGVAHPGEIPKTFPDIKEARELGVIGEGERGWKGEPSPAEGETKPQAGPGAEGATVLPEINVPAEPDLHAEARALKPEVFSEYDKLTQERDTFREWISDLSEERDGEPDLLRRGQIEKQIERVEGELAKTAPRLEELAPQVKEAYATARDQAGLPKLPVEPPAAAEPGAPVEPAPAETAAATPAEPPFSIAKDTESRLIAAGRPAEEARLHAAWTEAYWQQYAKRFQGRKGTAEEAYRRDAAEILGEDEDKLQRKAERAGRPAPQINEDKLSLIQFLAHKGGLKQTGDLSAIFNGNPFVPRFGRLFREGGMTLDRAREAAVEAGYINPSEFIGRAGGENTTKVSDLLNALQEESRGRKVYRPGHGPETPFDADQEAYERSIFEDQQEGREPHEAEENRGGEPPSHLTEEDRRVMEELFQTDSQEAGRRNEQGFILRLPYEDRWGDPRFNPEDRAKALARMTEIEKMPVKTAPWADLVQAKHDIDEVIAQLLYYKPETPVEEFRNVSDVEHELYLRRKKQNLGHDDSSPSHLDLEGVPEDIRDIVGSARTALDHLLDTDRRGVDGMLSYGREDEPRQRARPGERIRKPVDVSQTLPSGFHFMAGRKLAEVPDALFPQGGWAVINWLRQEGVTVAEIQHFLLDEKLGNKKPVTREDFQQAIADRMFDFKRKTSWLNPERSKADYEQGGTRAFTGPRIPGRGMYFERLMAFPKKLKGGEEFAPGHFESPHWDDVHKGTWASWRGSVREIPEWGKTVLGEEGQSDFMQGASVGKRPRMSEKEYLGLKADRGAYERVMDEASTLRREGMFGIPYEERQLFYRDLLPGEYHQEFGPQQWTEKLAELRKRVEASEPRPFETESKQKALGALDKVAELRAKNERFFEPGARDKFVRTESTFTPESPIDETYVRTMVRDLVMQAIKEKANSIAIATSETTGRIQNNPGAAHFYDEQLRPALQRELRRLTGNGSITLEKVKLPKAMGAPRNEKPYTVWAAKLDPAVYQGAKQKGFTLFQREPAPPFYSAVERAIENAKQDKASPQQWLGTLKNMAGVKPEELEWLGLEDWLKEQTGQVTRAEIEHYVKSNRTLIREVQKGVLSPAAAEARRVNEELISKYGDLGEAFRGWTPEEQARFDEAHGAASHEPKTPEAVQTKYSGTVLPGGQNYREFLLTLPPRAPVRKAYTVEVPRNPSGVSADREWRILDEAGNHIESRRTEGAARERAGELSDITAENSSEDYTKGHFDEPNVVAHIRFDDRTIDGKKTLFIQEVQSDWHQQGKRQGYQGQVRTSADVDKDIMAVFDEIKRRDPRLTSSGGDADWQRAWAENPDLKERNVALHEERQRAPSVGIPDAPFKATWPELTLKRMIRHAAEQGYDQISWPASAEAVAQVEGWGKIENRDRKWIIRDNKDVTPIVERYLKDMPRIASKLGKKFDAKIGRAEMDGTPVFTLPLTGKLSDAAMEQGFPLFQKGDIKRGKIRLRDEGPSTMTLFRRANGSTYIHESAHDFLHRMIRDARDADAPEDLKADMQATLDWLGVKTAEEIKTRHHEKFARAFEAYMMEGRAPSQGMARVFAKIREFMLAIYKNATALNVELSPEIRGVFDRLLGVNPDEVVIAPDMAKAETLADVHEADAVHANPHQSRNVANTVQSERDSHAGDNLIEGEDERLAGIEEGIGSRAPRGPEPDRDGAEPQVEPGEASGHPPTGTERAGGSEASPESSGVPGVGGAASGGQINTEPPAGAHVAFDTPPTDLIDKAGNIRLDKLDTPEDVKQVLRDASDANGGFIEARRGTMSDAEVLNLADALGMDAASLNRRRIGQALNAEQIMAARKLLIQSATTVRDAMIKAAEGTEADLLAYAEAKARHVMIQEQVAGITAEAGRALRAFRQIAGAKEAQLIGDFLKASTGQTLFQLQREAKLGKNLADPAQVSKFVHDSTKPTFGDMILEYWINGLISGPATHTTYAVGNALLALWKAGPETAAASLIGLARKAAGGDGPRVMAGEVPAQLFGMMKGMRQGVIAAYESAKSGQTTLLPGELQAMSMSQQAMSPMLNPKAMIPGPVGTVVRLPARGVAIIHSFFRAVNYQREMAALAYRTAGEEGLTGSAFAARVGEVMTNPDAGLMEQARASATDLTLMGKGGELTHAATKLTNVHFLGGQWFKFVTPFVHIGSNVLDQALLQRTALGVLDPEIRANLTGINGPIARDTAIARMGVGSALAIAAGSLAAEGLFNGSGPSDPKEKALWTMVNGPPHSVRVGDTWYDIHRLGPLGMLVGVAADMYEMAHHLHEEGFDNKTGALLARAFSENILAESWMSGFSQLLRAADNPDRYGEAWVRNFASSFTPYSVGSSQIARAIDPYSRQARSTIDAVKAKIPWLSQTLLPRRDIFGEPIPSKEALGVAGLSAIYEAKVNNDPTIRAMLDAKYFPGMPQHKIRGVELTDQQYDDFVRISGRMGKQRLDQIIRMQNFSELPEGVRMEMMRKAFDGAREIARTTVMMQNPNILRDAIDAKKAKLTGKKPETIH